MAKILFYFITRCLSLQNGQIFSKPMRELRQISLILWFLVQKNLSIIIKFLIKF